MQPWCPVLVFLHISMFLSSFIVFLLFNVRWFCLYLSLYVQRKMCNLLQDCWQILMNISVNSWPWDRRRRKGRVRRKRDYERWAKRIFCRWTDYFWRSCWCGQYWSVAIGARTKDAWRGQSVSPQRRLATRHQVLFMPSPSHPLRASLHPEPGPPSQYRDDLVPV